MNKADVIVMGAGIQGVCAALALNHQGFRVTLIDRAPDCMLRTSLNNEGKIHLGFVYAKDLSFRTPQLMLRAALHFAPLLDKWTGVAMDWENLKSHPFTYGILSDSMASPEQLLESYEKLQQFYQSHSQDRSLNYLGDRPSRLWWLESDRPPYVSQGNLIRKVIRTSEVALDTLAFRHLLRAQLAIRPGIRTLFGRQIESAVRTSRGFLVEGRTRAGRAWAGRAEILVNCLWDGRLAIDQELGIESRQKWVYRLKLGLLGRLPPVLAELPSLTFVQGPFGDIVNLRGNAYLSWYPSCLRGWSTDLSPPASWRAQELDPITCDTVTRDCLEAFEKLVPAIRGCRIHHVRAGTIFSWGETDITDPASQLHERHDIGVHSHGGDYFSIDTGKYTCAPYFAGNLANHLK